MALQCGGTLGAYRETLSVFRSGTWPGRGQLGGGRVRVSPLARGGRSALLSNAACSIAEGRRKLLSHAAYSIVEGRRKFSFHAAYSIFDGRWKSSFSMLVFYFGGSIEELLSHAATRRCETSSSGSAVVHSSKGGRHRQVLTTLVIRYPLFMLNWLYA